ncbi:hypothetical protein B0181_10235 [Moraxella caviae]|uniref:Uncharacterized protein n=1 Tax=Moraxella caviae TaxID=34060 RepID=A0A1S9ZVB6_9GAMM|nr:hypothetical protein [Moraxella caviae]OOR87472.1 hypothetical protein B0181_10235 [Moraxella caviae]STZ10627.1 Uncharacterised protein [Moraxella caviae]
MLKPTNKLPAILLLATALTACATMQTPAMPSTTTEEIVLQRVQDPAIMEGVDKWARANNAQWLAAGFDHRTHKFDIEIEFYDKYTLKKLAKMERELSQITKLPVQITPVRRISP